jgi:cell division inhibitor SulA
MTRGQFFQSISAALAGAGVAKPEEVSVQEESPKGKLYVFECDDPHMVQALMPALRRLQEECECRILVLPSSAKFRDASAPVVNVTMNVTAKQKSAREIAREISDSIRLNDEFGVIISPSDVAG